MPRPFIPKQANTPSTKDLKRKLKDMSSLLEAAEQEHENTLPLLIEHQAHMEQAHADIAIKRRKDTLAK